MLHCVIAIHDVIVFQFPVSEQAGKQDIHLGPNDIIEASEISELVFILITFVYRHYVNVFIIYI